MSTKSFMINAFVVKLEKVIQNIFRDFRGPSVQSNLGPRGWINLGKR